LIPRGQALAAAFTRGGRASLPNDDMCLERDDILHVSATLEGIEILRHRLASSQEEKK
jgi:hypothetical protein